MKAASSYEIRVQRLNETPDAPSLTTPGDAARYWQEVITTMPWFIPDRETCVVLTVNTKTRVTGHSLVSIGTLNETVVHIRDCFRAAVALNAYGILVLHNHPSGDSSPSEADRRITQRIAEASRILQIAFLDHIIVAGEGWFSFKEAGLL